MHDRIEDLVAGVEELFVREVTRRQRVGGRDPFRDDRVPFRLDELCDFDQILARGASVRVEGVS